MEQIEMPQIILKKLLRKNYKKKTNINWQWTRFPNLLA